MLHKILAFSQEWSSLTPWRSGRICGVHPAALQPAVVAPGSVFTGYPGSPALFAQRPFFSPFRAGLLTWGLWGGWPLKHSSSWGSQQLCWFGTWRWTLGSSEIQFLSGFFLTFLSLERKVDKSRQWQKTDIARCGAVEIFSIAVIEVFWYRALIDVKERPLGGHDFGYSLPL